MRVLVVGGGAREHALAWKLAQESPALELVAAPGNPGIAQLARCVPVAAGDIERLADLAGAERAELTLVGPEAPLAAGVVDLFRARGLPIFGPTRAAAEIETSKAFAKQLMLEAGVPTAAAHLHTDAAAARRSARELGPPVVIKASGLAAGKGVIVCVTTEEADRAIDLMLRERAFGDSGAEILVEEFMEGEELSVFGITDGACVVPLTPAQDHKRLLDGDRGPNTGGMGAYAPATAGVAPAAAGDLLREVVSTVMLPTLGALRARGAPFTGLLYAGLMLTRAGLKVVEFNCRFGDPETEAILPIVDLDPTLLELLTIVARGGELATTVRAPLRGHAVTTVLAAAGYPDRPRSGDRITLPPAEAGVHVFHAGTARDDAGELVTAGGRVFAVTAVADTLADAQRRSAATAARIEFAGKQHRSDIGWRELRRDARAP